MPQEFTLQPSPYLRTSKSVFSGGLEGMWTPVITFDTPGNLSVTYLDQDGFYFRLGALVICFFVVSTSGFTHTTASGALRIDGLPFTARQVDISVYGVGGGGMIWEGITKANYTSALAIPRIQNTYMNVVLSGSGQIDFETTAAEMPSGGAVTFQGCCIFLASEKA